MFTSQLCNFSKIFIKTILFKIETNNGTVEKSKYPTSVNKLPVLASQFFKINYLHTSKIISFYDSRSIIDS